MKNKYAVKLIVDILMSLALLFSMGYQFWGEAPHEWMGSGMFILFIVHHILNFSWHRSLFKGKYTPLRFLNLCIDLLVLLSMLALMYSGIVMSRYVFDFLPTFGSVSVARRLHILGSYWGFILTSVHLGMHWNMVTAMAKKTCPYVKVSKGRSVLFSVIGALIWGYGVFVFVKRDFLTYMFLKSEFVFLNYDESRILFYADCIALSWLCIFAAHYGTKPLRNLREKSRHKKSS